MRRPVISVVRLKKSAWEKNSLCYFSSGKCFNSSTNPSCVSTDQCSKCLLQTECNSRGSSCVWSSDSCRALGCADSDFCALCTKSASECNAKAKVCYYRSSENQCVNSSLPRDATCVSTDACSSCLSSYDCDERGSNCEWTSGSFSCNEKKNKSQGGGLPGWAYFLMIGLPIILVAGVAGTIITVIIVIKMKKKIPVVNGAVDHASSSNHETVSYPPQAEDKDQAQGKQTQPEQEWDNIVKEIPRHQENVDEQQQQQASEPPVFSVLTNEDADSGVQ